jgi:predicted ribosomally synthesized peptide with SipW-like signal peptide
VHIPKALFVFTLERRCLFIKNILRNILVIGIVAAFAVAVTQAFFSDEEKSTGNVFTAGKIDLKIDHTMASYNGIDCRTCSVILISDTSNMVIAKDDVLFETPYPAVFLSSIHPAWTAQNDPSLTAADAKWIWEEDPVKQEDTTTDVTYTFRKTFTWFGPITGSDFTMAVGHDNTVEVYLNNVLIGSSNDIYGFRIENMLHIAAANITGNVVQGENVMEIKLTNQGLANGNPGSNPAGLIYKFEINGNCQDDFFLNQCNLWDFKDLAQGDIFWNFDDVKPGDWGRNVISYHVYDNDAYMCTFLEKTDLENTMTPPESPPDVEGPEGELSKYLDVFVWHDLNGNGIYEGEPVIAHEKFANMDNWPIAQPPGSPIKASTDNYIGVAWCFGVLGVSEGNPFTCDGDGDYNKAQTDSLIVDLNFYAEQARHNSEFSCDNFVTPTPVDQ